MFNFVRQPSRGAGLAIGYVTGGALAMIWAGIWWYYMNHHGTEADWKWYVCSGLFLSGLALFLIGLFVGRIGREAKQADGTLGVQTPAGTQQVVPAAMPQATAPMAVAPAPGQVAVPNNGSPVMVR